MSGNLGTAQVKEHFTWVKYFHANTTLAKTQGKNPAEVQLRGLTLPTNQVKARGKVNPCAILKSTNGKKNISLGRFSLLFPVDSSDV